MELPEVRLQRILKENNLTISLARPTTKYIENGGIIVEFPNIQVSFIDQAKEEVHEQTTEAVASETPTN